MQTKSVAVGLGGEAVIENSSEVFRRNSDPVVLDRKLHQKAGEYSGGDAKGYDFSG